MQAIESSKRRDSSIQNIPLGLINNALYLKSTTTNIHKKGLPAGKCMRIVGDILLMCKNFIREGVYSLNLASFSMEYLGALKGQHLDSGTKKKIFI